MKRFLLGFAFPALLLCDAIMCFTGERTGVKAIPLPREGIIAVGISELGFALGIHAYFSEWYDDRPTFRNTLIGVGAFLILLSLGYSTCLPSR